MENKETENQVGDSTIEKYLNKIDALVIKILSFVRLEDRYQGKFQKFVRFTFIMGLGYLVNTPLIWLFLDVCNVHWFVSMGLAAFIVHIAKFMFSDVWVWGK